MPRRKPLPVIRKVNISPCHVMWENGASCSIVVDPHEQVIVADVVKECCWVTVLLISSFGVKVTIQLLMQYLDMLMYLMY